MAHRLEPERWGRGAAALTGPTRLQPRAPAETPPASGLATPGLRDPVTARLRFARGGGRTYLERQSVPYPFHVTRPHYLDRARPDRATLILQSAAGGLFRGDRLEIDIVAGRETHAEVASQAATVVHATREDGVMLRTRIDVGAGAVLTMRTDPFILFPGTTLSSDTRIALAPDATAVVAEGFAIHDPTAAQRPFDRLSLRCRVQRSDGTILVDEGGDIDGHAFSGMSSPLGCHRAMGVVMILGQAGANLDLDALDAAAGHDGTLAGATRLPNGAGTSVRILAGAGGRLAAAMDAVTTATLTSIYGASSSPRRR